MNLRDALIARVNALEEMLDEREERTKERFAAMDKAALGVSGNAVSREGGDKG